MHIFQEDSLNNGYNSWGKNIRPLRGRGVEFIGWMPYLKGVKTMNDIYWLQKMTNYIERYAFFSEKFTDLTEIDDLDIIGEQFLLCISDICDCEGCRAESECVVEVPEFEDE